MTAAARATATPRRDRQALIAELVEVSKMIRSLDGKLDELVRALQERPLRGGERRG